MANIYDYIKHSGVAIKDGYEPCYLTRVSAVICNVTNNYRSWYRRYINFGFDKSLRENMMSFSLPITMVIITVTLPVNCWFLALLLPRADKK